jgi:hypothetical protein
MSHRLSVVASVLATSLLSISAHALPFTPVIDEFWIMKRIAPGDPVTVIFRDSFSDGAVPPSGPDGAATYGMFGPGGMTGEAGGKLTMTPSLGESVLITATFADLGTQATRTLSTMSTIPTNANFLGKDSSFEIHGLYDLSVLPGVAGQGFGIRATDRAPPLSNPGDNTVQLNVGVNAVTGDVSVILRLLDFATDTSTLIEIFSIEPFLFGADQIELILSKALDSDQVAAFFVIYGSGNPTFTVAMTKTVTIYVGEDYIRGAFESLDRVPIPEPVGLALFGLGLAGIGIIRRRRRTNGPH